MNVLVVESAAKAKTLERYLGEGWRVLATGGHVQTLPHDRAQHGKDAKKAYWANQAGALPSPPWVWTDRGEDAVRDILGGAGDDPVFWLATDPDREGEFIAWCLERLLSERGPTHRVSFQEVTEEAVRAAIERPRPVDASMVESALLRKFLDRIVGYRTSKLARAVIPGGNASMGRVQTPALGFVVDRELEREAHVPIPYFEVRLRAGTVDLQVRFHESDDEAAWRDEAGRMIATRTFDGDLAMGAERALREAGRVTLTEVTRGTRSSNPKPPFSTDALLQAAGSRFGWSPKKTSALASLLYEAGHITYIRTDSTRLAASAVASARKAVIGAFGEDHLGPTAPAGPAPEGATAGAIQDAHEAIRPTRFEDEDVPVDDADARKLYRLLRAHTLAAQMAPSRFATVKLRASAEGLSRPLAGTASWRTFDGWEAAYEEFRATPATSPPPETLEEGAVWDLDEETEGQANPSLIEDETRPPARYRPHTLIKAMKDGGIGRPSTYSKTVEKLEDRTYVRLEDGALVPTERGRAVWLEVAPLYRRDNEKSELFSADFTALMEERLDSVARGEDPAPDTWERWRDEVRDLHEIARERKNRGAATPRTREQLERLLENAPAEFEHPDDLEALSEREAREHIQALRDAGVLPAPTTNQMGYLQTLVEQLDMTASEAAALIELGDLTDIRTSAQASALIEELSTLRDERRPPSRKQIGLIERLRAEAGLSEPEAAALVDEPDMEGLTGGREGTASALIDKLLELQAKPAGEPA
ncbi:MAG: type IA DNA topoisomerase [Gemmatimonadota bacterium]